MKASILSIAVFAASFFVQAQNSAINWVKKNGPVGGEIMDVEVDNVSGKVFLLDGYGRPFVSSDNGNTWQEITVSSGLQTFDDIEVINNIIYLVGYWELYASTDGGVTFQERMTEVSPYEGAERLKRMPSSGNLIVLTRQSDIYTSSNGGQTWTIKNSTLSNVDTRFLQVNAVDQIFILKYDASSIRRPFRSVDGGVTFTEASTGIPVGHHVLGLFAENNGAKLYCITAEGVFSSTNGNTWANEKTGSMTDLIIADYGQGASIIEFSADGQGMYFIDNVNHKLHSKLLSAPNWELQATAFPSGALSVTAASAKDFTTPTTATAYFGTQTGIFRTTTGGASVSEGNTGIASVRAEQLEIDDSGNLYLKTNTTGLMKSQDGGNNWTKITTLSENIDHFFTSVGGAVLYAILSDNILMRSYNEGGSWFPVAPAGTYVWAGAADENKVFALQHTSYPAALYYSDDDGSTWTPSAVPITGLPASYSIHEESIVFASPTRMLLSLYEYDLAQDFYFRIDFTYDANNTITSAVATKIMTMPIPMSDVHTVVAGNGKFYFYDAHGPSGDRVAISSDGGLTWATRPVPEGDELFLLSNGYLFVTDGSDEKIHLSRDNGLTFQETNVPSETDVYNLRDIGLDVSGYAYLAFTGNYMYQSTNPIVVPETPTSLQHAGYSSTSAALTWSDPNHFERDIVVERSRDGITFREVGLVDGWDACSGDGGKSYYIDTNLQPATTYTYRIFARNQAGSSLPGSTITVTTLAECTPTLPENRSWSAINSGTEGYTLLAAPVSIAIKHLGGGKYEISDLSLGLTGSPEKSIFYESCGQTHVGYVDDANPNSNGSWDGTTLTLKWRACNSGKTETITLTVNTNDPIPEQPVALRAYVLSNTTIEINWSTAYYEKSYVIERSLNAASGWTEIATIDYPATRYIDNGPFTEGTTYYYRMKALNANATPQASPYSAVTSVPFHKPNFIVAANAMTDFKANATIASMWADFNNDGLDDYFTMQFDPQNQLARPVIFKNLGAGSYEAVHPAFGSTTYFWASVADYDNDHYPDIALSSDGERIFDLFKGNGDLTFAKVAQANLGDLAVIAKEISSSSWADVNNDGLLDIILLNQEDGSFTLYKQNTDHSFTNIYTSPPSEDEPIMAIWSDYDNDGYQDVLLGNLDGQGGLYRNNGDETFSPATASGFAGANFFAAAWGDYNNDGHVDLFCGSVSKNALYKNNGDGTFTEDLTTSISEGNFTVSASWGDFNNDGYLDLVTAGFPTYQTRLFLRDPSVTSGIAFRKVVAEKINDLSISHYSVAGADPDQNGLRDLMLSAFVMEDEDDDALLPTNNNFYQNNNAVSNWSEVKLKGKTGNAESIGAKITLTAGGKTQTREISAMSSLFSRNSTVAHFGLGTETTITNIQIRWPNGGIQNYPLPPANQILVIDEDITGPVITSRTPSHTAVDVSTTTALTLTFDENVFPVNGKMIEITKVGETSAFTSIDAGAGSKNGNQVTYSLPVTLDGETLYRVTIEAGAFRDRWLNASTAVGPFDWRFTTGRSVDATAPMVAFSVPGTLAKGFGTVNPSITVTDDFGVANVVVSIRKISGSTYTNVTASAGATANTYAAQLSEATHFDAIGAEFYITATDLSGNTTRDPLDPTATHKVYISYTAAQAAIPTTSLGLGGQKTNWKVFAIPFDIPAPNNGVSAIFNEIASTNDKKKFRLITYGTPTKWFEYPDAFSVLSRGTGYFINIKDDPGAIGLFDLTPPSNHRSNLFEISLKAGWNMVGNPYLTPISWDDVAALNGLTGAEAQLKTFSNGTYSNDQTLGPFEGGFVNIATAKTILIPFQGQTSSGGRRGVPTLDLDISAEAWAIPLSVHQGGVLYTLAGVGMAPDADLSIDIYDDLTPPRFFDFLEVNFSHPEHIARNFTRDIVPTRQNYTWDFTIDSNLEGMAELTWNNAPLATSVKEIFLLDVGSQQLIDMKGTSTHVFDPKASSHFRIYYGENLQIAPEEVKLGNAYPNPTSGLTTIAFSLPEAGGLNQSVSVEVLDNLGRPVGHVKQGMFNPGYHEASFDATGMVSGFYTYRLNVKNANGRIIQLNKLIIK